MPRFTSFYCKPWSSIFNSVIFFFFSCFVATPLEEYLTNATRGFLSFLEMRPFSENTLHSIRKDSDVSNFWWKERERKNLAICPSDIFRSMAIPSGKEFEWEHWLKNEKGEKKRGKEISIKQIDSQRSMQQQSRLGWGRNRHSDSFLRVTNLREAYITRNCAYVSLPRRSFAEACLGTRHLCQIPSAPCANVSLEFRTSEVSPWIAVSEPRLSTLARRRRYVTRAACFLIWTRNRGIVSRKTG